MQASVDDGLKTWEEAKAEQEATQLLIATYESELKDLNGAMDRTVDDLAHLTENFAALSLSGPFSAQVEKAIRHLEHRCKEMEREGVTKEQLVKTQEGLDLMKRKLNLLKKAEEKAPKDM